MFFRLPRSAQRGLCLNECVGIVVLGLVWVAAGLLVNLLRVHVFNGGLESRRRIVLGENKEAF